MMLKLKYITLITLCTFITAYSQTTGSITGKIIDQKTGGPLPGANLMLLGTVMGTSSNVDGEFNLDRVPPGTYQIRVSMMGYTQSDKTGVIIRAGSTTRLNFELDETVLETREVQVTANKRRQSIRDAVTSVGVVTTRQIQQKNEIFLNKVLEQSSGVNFIGNQINIRGSSGFNYGAGSRVLMLVDGVPVMPGDSGDIKWDVIPTTQVEQIEIIKGAGSALYGSSALGGVINIITKKPSLKPVTNIRLASGIYDSPRFDEWKWTDKTLHFENVNIDHSRVVGNTEILMSAGHLFTTGFSQNTENRRYNASMKIHTRINGQHNLTVSSNFDAGKRYTGLLWRSQRKALEVPQESLGDYDRSDKFSLNTFHNWIVNKNFRLKTRLSYFQNFWKNYYHDSDNASTAKRTGLEIQGDYQISNYNSLIFGTEEAWDHVNSGLVGNHDQYTIAFFLQNERYLLENLILTLGLRYDYQDVDTGFSDSELSPKAGLVWHTHPMVTLRASTGKGFRAASMSERFSDSMYSGFRLTPNINLKSEVAWSHEIGLNIHPAPNFIIDIAGFQSDYWDLIEPEPDENQIVQFTNVTRARITGIETHVNYRPWFIRGLSLDVGYTLMDPQDLDLDNVLAYRSKNLVNASATWQIGFVETGLDYIYAKRLEKVKIYPNDERVSQKTLNGRLSFKIKNYSFNFNANNIFNHNHTQMERTLLPIRHYVFSINASI